MYDINRSNLLSVETLKMYLYDISMLASARNTYQKRAEALKEERSTYGKKTIFDDSGLRCIEFKLPYILIYSILYMLFLVVITYIIYGIEPELLASILRVKMRRLKEREVWVRLFLIEYGIALFIAFLYYIYIQYRNMITKRERDTLKNIFEQNEERRLEKERKMIEEIDLELSEIQSKIDKLDQEIKTQFELDILHENYQDTEICGVMFQLLDTGRVDTLIDAMNMYEDLKWKSEMKEMMQAMIEKASEIIKQQKNMEYYSRCITNNQEEIDRILQGIAINQQCIARNQRAIKINTDIIESNTKVMRMLGEFGLING